jgi:hypothetical protein
MGAVLGTSLLSRMRDPGPTDDVLGDAPARLQIMSRARRKARATASVRPFAPSLVMMEPTWNFAVEFRLLR